MSKDREYVIVCDTREQKPLFTKNVTMKALETGDYSIEGYEDKIAIERKSLMDLYGTLGQGHARFKKELERAQSLEYFAIVIDGTYKQVLTKDFIGSWYSKMKGHVISKILTTLSVKYGINIFFASDRTRSKTLIKQLMESYLTWASATEQDNAATSESQDENPSSVDS